METRRHRRYLVATLGAMQVIVLGVAVCLAHGARRRGTGIVILMFVAGTAAAGFVVARRQALRQHRTENGLCPKCGYDLRATPSRCPECGTTQE